MSDLIGQMLGQYQITALLGEGGMASVYRAHQKSMKRDVAIKVIESKLARNPEFVKRFEREAQTVASLDHPHILKVFDFGQEGDLIYLVMELKTGGTLAQQKSEQPSLEHISSLLTQIASALDYAHKRGIIHRDLKPQNVLLDEQGNAFLTDFGIAKLIQMDYTSLTQTGAAMGTPTYMSPEQWQNHVIDARSDLYSLGIMVYELLVGQIPFRADTPAAMMFAHIQQKPPPLREFRSGLPRTLEPVMAKALAKLPDERFQTGKALADAFKNALNGTPMAAAKPLAPSRNSDAQPTVLATESEAPRRISLPFIIAAILLALLVIGGILYTAQRNASVPPTASDVANLITPTAPVVAAVATKLEPSATLRPSETPAPSLTATPIPASPTLTPTDTVTASATVTASIVPSQPASPTLDFLQIVASLDALATEAVRVTNIAASQTAIIGETQTATAWTKTPTVTSTPTIDISATIASFITQRAEFTSTAVYIRNATSTAAVWTKTPTITNTPTVTITASNTATATHTATPRATATFTPSPTTPPTEVPTSTSLPAIARNSDWTPQIVTIDGVDMVVVPPGCFMMGNVLGSNSEQPVHEVCITKSFYLDRFEVTNDQFAAKDGKATKPSRWTDANNPRETISWAEADAYCQQRGGRLATEAEWEYAARGPDELGYPWGNTFISVYAMYFTNGRRKTGEVGETKRPDGKSWVGAYDMSGNVWEWIADTYGKYPTDKQTDPLNSTGSDHVLRGGASFYDATSVRTSYRLKGSSIGNYTYYIGIRCARSF